jgi:hypothetical protein
VEKTLATSFVFGNFFKISMVNQAAQAFQGHKLVKLEGDFSSIEMRMAEGSFLVRTAQPLGALAFYLLEAESTDGIGAWGILQTVPKVGDPFPIVKLLKSPNVPTELVR